MKEKCRKISTIEDRYRRAQSLMQGIGSKKLVRNGTLFPTWIESSDCCWYEREMEGGKQYRLVDAVAATNELAFDHGVFATIFAETVEQTVDANNLPITEVVIEINPLRIIFSAFEKRWKFDAVARTCTALNVKTAAGVISPDGRFSVFDRDYNLWIRDLESGEERSLTRDGEEFYCYGALGTAWGVPTAPDNTQVLWSPDSKRIFTVQRDTRQVECLPIETGVTH